MTIVDNTVEFKSTPVKGNELLLGAGNSTKKQLHEPNKEAWTHLVTLDMDPDSNPDVLWNLEHMPLPFEDETFKEIHAYDVLEHLGTQGDWRTFFKQFEEFHRILKPGGQLFAITPAWDSVHAWGDPGHTRIINEGTIVFLNQDAYSQVGKTPMTDYRSVYKADFEIVHSQITGERYTFVLRKK